MPWLCRRAVIRISEFSHVAREAIRSRLGIGSDACLAIGVGYADLRKGIDLFLQVWMAAQRAGSEMHFCWVGGTDPNIAAYLSADIAAAEGTGRFHMAGFCTECCRLLFGRRHFRPDVARGSFSNGGS